MHLRCRDLPARASLGLCHPGWLAAPAGEVARNATVHQTHNDLTHKERGDGSSSSISIIPPFFSSHCAPAQTPREGSSSTSVLPVYSDLTHDQDSSRASPLAVLVFNHLTHKEGSGSTASPLRALLSFFFIAVLLMTPALAIGLKPAQQTLTFEPNLAYNGQFDVVRDNDRHAIASASVEGNLSEYISIDTTLHLLGETQSIPYKVTLPRKMRAGTYTAVIYIEEQTESANTINAHIRIPFTVHVDVPQPSVIQSIVEFITGLFQRAK